MSSKTIVVIMFIILPLFGGLLAVLELVGVLPPSSDIFLTVENSTAPVEPSTVPVSPASQTSALILFFYSTIYAGAYFYVVLIYGLFAIRFRKKKDFEKRGFHNLVKEVEIERKLLLVAVPLLIPLIILAYGPFQLDISPSVITIVGLLTFVIMGAGLRFVLQIGRKESYLYLCYGYCITMDRTNDYDQKIRYYWSVLSMYNKYLHRISGFKVNNFEKVYSIFMSSDPETKDDMIKSVCSNIQQDSSVMVKYLSTVTDTKSSEILQGETLNARLKRIGAVLIVAIPVLISTVELIRKFSASP